MEQTLCSVIPLASMSCCLLLFGVEISILPVGHSAAVLHDNDKDESDTRLVVANARAEHQRRDVLSTKDALHPDIVTVIDVVGAKKPKSSWRDSYSAGGRCYCDTGFDDGLDTMLVETGTSLGTISVIEACTMIGKGPGRRGNPKYNDVQCGNGPYTANEDECPGRVDIGPDGCGQIGPKWDFTDIITERPTPAPIDIVTHPDIVMVIDVAGVAKPKKRWRDSYSVGDECYCDSSFADGLDKELVDTGYGVVKTVKEVCDLLGPGPGRRGRPQYNDIQCGNGPAVSKHDMKCPGRVDIGSEGCGHIGPKWKFNDLSSGGALLKPPTLPDLHPDIVKVIDVVGEKKPKKNWRDSYSVGDQCYCDTRYDHGIGPILVDTPYGIKLTVKQVCKLIGKGPGRDGNPVYNDVQCGNGPPNDWGDEDTCPGRTDIGPDGCGQIGPKWNFMGISLLSQPDALLDDTDIIIIAPEPPSVSPSTKTSYEPSDIPSNSPALQ